MKILVVNGSPRGAAGNTAVLTKAFVEGAEECGATSETVYLAQKRIEHCCGNFVCWLKTPGVCARQDDMAELLAKVRESDVLVYATPLYCFTVTSMMKAFMDRHIPLVQPFISVQDGISHHPSRYGPRTLKAVVISNCGFPEPSHFSGLKETFRQLLGQSRRTAAGMICCAGGELLRNPAFREMTAWYTDGVRQAGREVVTDGQVSEATQALLDRSLIPDSKMFADAANKHFLQMGVEPLGDEAKAICAAAMAG